MCSFKQWFVALFLGVYCSLFSVGSLAWLDDSEVAEKQENLGATEPEDPDEPTLAEKQELQQLKMREQKAKEELIEKLAPYWSDPAFSDQSRWISYSEDLSIQRVVDFEKNEFNLTLPRFEKDGRTDFVAVKEVASGQLKKLISMTIAEAIEQDPLLSVWGEEEKSDGRSSKAADKYLDSLVFSELFSTKDPSEKAMHRVAEKLMEKSYIPYEGNYSLASKSDKSPNNSTVEVPIHLHDKIQLRVPLPSDRLMRKAREYQKYVTRFAAEHNVPPHIIYAVIHTESHFNPLAKSSIPAFGLMQVVPQTAGRDVSKFIFKNKKRINSTFLYNPENNIHVGTGYLRVLYYRYLRKIKDPESRLYCAIASYNTGSANVARAFIHVPRMQEATPVINNMSSEQVLNRLLEKLPARETKDYLRKVLERAPHYTQFDQLVIER